VFFSEVAEAPHAAATRRTVLVDPNTDMKYKLPVKKSYVFKQIDFSQSQIEILKCAWEQLPHIRKSRYWEKYKKSGN
jgi:hypothetical protein